jgi:hypothetical protein
MFRLVCALLILSGLICFTAPAGARSSDGNSMAGTWIWDPDLFIPWPNMPQDPRLVAETLSVVRDDGRRFVAHVELGYSDGERNVFDEDFAEDGADHPVVTTFGQMMVHVTVEADGARRTVSSSLGTLHDSVCYLLDGGMTLSCEGTHHAADGSVGYFRCVYHRDAHMVRVSQLAPRQGAG